MDSRHIYKYPVRVGAFTLELPRDAEILSVQVQDAQPYMWAIVAPDASLMSRQFEVFGTGHPIITAAEDLIFIGTFQLYGGTFVGHLFEVFPPETASQDAQGGAGAP